MTNVKLSVQFQIPVLNRKVQINALFILILIGRNSLKNPFLQDIATHFRSTGNSYHKWLVVPHHRSDEINLSPFFCNHAPFLKDCPQKMAVTLTQALSVLEYREEVGTELFSLSGRLCSRLCDALWPISL